MHHVFIRGVARSAVAVDDADYEHSLSAARARRSAIRTAVPCVVLSPEPLPSARDLGAREPLPGDALARNVHGAVVQPAPSSTPAICTRGALDLGWSKTTAISSSSRATCLSTLSSRALQLAGRLAVGRATAATAGLDCRTGIPRHRHAARRLGSPSAYAAWVTDGVLATDARRAAAFLARRRARRSRRSWPIPRSERSRLPTFATATARQQSLGTWASVVRRSGAGSLPPPRGQAPPPGVRPRLAGSDPEYAGPTPSWTGLADPPLRWSQSTPKVPKASARDMPSARSSRTGSRRPSSARPA